MQWPRFAPSPRSPCDGRRRRGACTDDDGDGERPGDFRAPGRSSAPAHARCCPRRRGRRIAVRPRAPTTVSRAYSEHRRRGRCVLQRAGWPRATAVLRPVARQTPPDGRHSSRDRVPWPTVRRPPRVRRRTWHYVNAAGVLQTALLVPGGRLRWRVSSRRRWSARNAPDRRAASYAAGPLSGTE